MARNDNGSLTGVKDLLGACASEFGQHVSKIFAKELQAQQTAAAQTCVPRVTSPQDICFINCRNHIVLATVAKQLPYNSFVNLVVPGTFP